MRTTAYWLPAVMLLLTGGGSALAQQTEVADSSATTQHGIQLFDSGDLAGARAVFEGVLARNPDDAWARYELAYTHHAAGEEERCITEASVVASGRSPHRARAITLVGNCLAAAGREKDALKQYQKGLKEFPDDIELNFNAAVSLARLDKTKDAKKLLKHALKVNPQHASSLYPWAMILNAEQNRAPAVLVCLRFLMLDHASARAGAAAKVVLAQLGAGIEQKGNEINLSIPATAARDEGEFTSLELGISMSAAGMTLDEEQAKPIAQRTVDSLETVIKLTDELTDAKLRKTDVWKLAAAPLVGLQHRGLWQPFGYVVVALAGVEGAAQWVASHGAEVSALENAVKPGT